MKKFINIICVLFFMVGIIGCNSLKNPITFNSDMKELTALIVAEELGERFADEYPNKVKFVEGRIENLLTLGSGFQVLFDKSVEELSKEISNNPSTQKKLEVIISQIEINNDIALNKELIKAFKIGLDN